VNSLTGLGAWKGLGRLEGFGAFTLVREMLRLMGGSPLQFFLEFEVG
jgi:hypothetical protein